MIYACNKTKPCYITVSHVKHFLRFQGIFMMYLYVGSIVAIMCIYISVLLDQCPSLTGRSSREPLTNNGDPESGSVTSFGTLRRAHIDRNKVSRTSFYLRVGALGKICLFAKEGSKFLLCMSFFILQDYEMTYLSRKNCTEQSVYYL